MNARRYTLILIAGAFTLLASTVVANVVTDPEDVFGTKMFPPTKNLNHRNQKFLAYKMSARSVDALLFASSRGNFFDDKALSQKMGATNVFNAAVAYGLISDHLPLLEYVLRDKKAHGERLKAVLLMLDADFFGKPPWTQSNIDSFLPPELSNESAARYWLRYLTVFQFRHWRDVIRGTDGVSVTQQFFAEPVTVGQADAGAAAPLRMTPRFTTYRRSFNSTRPDFERQIRQLGRFVALCREHGVDLRIAISPAIVENLRLHEPGVLAGIVDKISRTEPLWDFTSSAVSVERGYWADFSHYNHRAATMILDRIYGGSEVVSGFGVLRGAR